MPAEIPHRLDTSRTPRNSWAQHFVRSRILGQIEGTSTWVVRFQTELLGLTFEDANFLTMTVLATPSRRSGNASLARVAKILERNGFLVREVKLERAA